MQGTKRSLAVLAMALVLAGATAAFADPFSQHRRAGRPHGHSVRPKSRSRN